MNQHTPEREIYRNPWLAVYEEQFEAGRRSKIAIMPGAMVCAVDRDASVYFVRCFRYALARSVLELPGGGIEAGQTPQATVERELLEETGLMARTWIPLPSRYSMGNEIQSAIHIFLALDLTVADEWPMDDDRLTIERIPYRTAKEMVFDGRIDHAFSGLALLEAEPYLRRIGLLSA